MHEQATQPPRHESTDIEARPLWITAVLLLVSFLLIPPCLFWLFKYYEKAATHPDHDLIRFKSPPAQSPEPRVQGIPGYHDSVPRADMEQYRKESEQRLHSYGQAEEKGFVRIPIERAIELLSTQPTTREAK